VLGNALDLPLWQFAECIKGLKSWNSLQSKVDDEIARCKQLVTAEFDRATGNLVLWSEKYAERRALFPDLRTLLAKAPEDFAAVCAGRVRAAEEEEERRRLAAEEKAEAERKAAEARAAAAAMAPAAAPVAQPPASTVRTMPNMGRTFTRAPESAAAPAGPPTLRLGAICERLGFTVTSARLAELGIEGTRERQSVLYHEADWHRICDVLVQSIEEAREGVPA